MSLRQDTVIKIIGNLVLRRVHCHTVYTRRCLRARGKGGRERIRRVCPYAGCPYTGPEAGTTDLGLRTPAACCRYAAGPTPSIRNPPQEWDRSGVVPPGVAALHAPVKLGGGLVGAARLQHPPDRLVVAALLAVDLDGGKRDGAVRLGEYVEPRIRGVGAGRAGRLRFSLRVAALATGESRYALSQAGLTVGAELQGTSPPVLN